MSYVIQCHVCKGQKKLLGLGNMWKNCIVCSGTGWLHNEMPSARNVATSTESVKNKNGNPIEVKKRGRKPKITEPEILQAEVF